MAKQHSSGERDSQEERNKRQGRAERILDVAAALIQRWGYNKTTIDDIAKQAGVAKGTIYLHWKTREDLFRALLFHEERKLAEEIKQRMAADPEGATFYGVIKHTMLATMKNPLWKALFLRDSDMLGELTRRELGSPLAAERTESFLNLFRFLREQGLIRTDQSLEAQIHLISAISIGFLMVEPFMPDELRLSDDEAVEVMTDALKRALEPRTSTTSTASLETEEITQAVDSYFEHEVNLIKEQEQKEMQS
ncbi:MAG TPA: helix-turn-helix domain-containing protein [Ktedonobacteraceae bacterium]|nr:helix-turn-helix domain-containing protein [Ktedonobacteraceae bacterium]